MQPRHCGHIGTGYGQEKLVLKNNQLPTNFYTKNTCCKTFLPKDLWSTVWGV